MASIPYVTGPAHAFVGQTQITSISNGNVTAKIVVGPYYLGTAERAPRIEISDDWEPVDNDVSGKKPLDTAWSGEDALITYDFTRWDEAVMARLSSNPVPFFGARGVFVPGTMGTLMITEGRVPTLWVQFPYGGAGGKPVYAVNGMPAGYRFFAANFEGPHVLDRLGTRAMLRHAVFHALPVYAQGYELLFDHNMAGLPPTT